MEDFGFQAPSSFMGHALQRKPQLSQQPVSTGQSVKLEIRLKNPVTGTWNPGTFAGRLPDEANFAQKQFEEVPYEQLGPGAYIILPPEFFGEPEVQPVSEPEVPVLEPEVQPLPEPEVQPIPDDAVATIADEIREDLFAEELELDQNFDVMSTDKLPFGLAGAPQAVVVEHFDDMWLTCEERIYAML